MVVFPVPDTVQYLMSLKTKSLIVVILLSLTDIVVPLPILGGLLVYVILQKPDWFRTLVGNLYGKN